MFITCDFSDIISGNDLYCVKEFIDWNLPSFKKKLCEEYIMTLRLISNKEDYLGHCFMLQVSLQNWLCFSSLYISLHSELYEPILSKAITWQMHWCQRLRVQTLKSEICGFKLRLHHSKTLNLSRTQNSDSL